jgi:hypothetical protein
MRMDWVQVGFCLSLAAKEPESKPAAGLNREIRSHLQESFTWGYLQG